MATQNSVDLKGWTATPSVLVPSGKKIRLWSRMRAAISRQCWEDWRILARSMKTVRRILASQPSTGQSATSCLETKTASMSWLSTTMSR